MDGCGDAIPCPHGVIWRTSDRGVRIAEEEEGGGGDACWLVMMMVERWWWSWSLASESGGRKGTRRERENARKHRSRRA
jgi:hypothetical protein